jgi:hypothetical protein
MTDQNFQLTAGDMSVAPMADAAEVKNIIAPLPTVRAGEASANRDGLAKLDCTLEVGDELVGSDKSKRIAQGCGRCGTIRFIEFLLCTRPEQL